MLEHYPSMVQNALNVVSEMGPALGFRQAVNNNVGEGMISVKQESSLMAVVCASCGRGIADPYLMRVNERDYHENCLTCAECATPLSHVCYTRNFKYYCPADYRRVFPKCGRCQQKIGSTELVMKVPVRPHGPVFHVDCFVCCMCGDQLPRGAKYVLRHGLPVCKREFNSDMYNINSPQDDDLLDDTRPRDGRRGPKRPRTILTSAQRRQFKNAFEISPKPCRKVREALAKETGLSVRVVQVWFQNQRAKMKKMQRKAKAEPGSDKEPKEGTKPESPHSDQNHYMKALTMRDGESSNFPSATQPLNPNNPYSPNDAYPGHSGDSYCSSDISIDGTEAAFELGESESGTGPEGSHQGSALAHLPGGGAGGGAAVPAGENPEMSISLVQSLHVSVHNPIDKLCMMHASYFCSVEHP